MDDFNIGDTVRITGSVMPGSVGSVVFKDDGRKLYLVRITGETQYYYPAEDLELFKA